MGYRETLAVTALEAQGAESFVTMARLGWEQVLVSGWQLALLLEVVQVELELVVGFQALLRARLRLGAT